MSKKRGKSGLKMVKGFFRPNKDKFIVFLLILIFHIIIDYFRFLKIIPYDLLLGIYYIANFVLVPFFSIANYYTSQVLNPDFILIIIIHLLYWYMLACIIMWIYIKIKEPKSKKLKRGVKR